MGFSILGYEEGDEDRYLDEGVLENHPEPPEEVRHGSSQQITTVEDDVREEACNSSDQPPSHYDTTSMNNPPYQNLPNNSSILGDMTLFRDFFLAAFSDYNVASCCGGDSFFDERNPVTTDRNSYCSAKLPTSPSDHSSSSCHYQHNHHHHPITIRASPLIGRTTSSLSQNSTPAIQNNTSHDSKRRQRPLAVAVGFKYAEDMNGRPIIITPGNRRMPIRGPGGSSSLSSSPASQPKTVSRKEVTPGVLFPHEHETRKDQQMSYKPDVPQLPVL